MKLAPWTAAVLAVVVVMSSACCRGSSGGGKGTGGGTGTGSGTGTGTGTGSGVEVGGDPALCDGLDAHVKELYVALAARSEGEAQNGAKMTDDEIGDNVAMVMRDCRAQPARVAACAKAATSVAQLESKCVIPIDDEGNEGTAIKP